MITFRNAGLIDIRAVTTFGVSVKDGDNPIGFFGTGLKYAISIILRNGGKVRLWRGQELFEFTVDQATIRGKDFGIIQMNGLDLGFTTHVGSTWAIWQAFREIYCNMLDERGQAFAGPAVPEEGYTTIEIAGVNEFDECFFKKNEIVLVDTPLHQLEYNGRAAVDIREGPSRHMYYRGILAAELDRVCVFCYSMTYPLALTEDRTLKSMYSAMSVLANAVAHSENAEFIMQFLQAPFDTFENHFDFGGVDEKPSEVFLNCCQRALDEKNMPLNKSVMAVLAQWRKVQHRWENMELSASENMVLAEACAMMRLMGYAIDKYPIVIIKNLGPKTLGRAVDKTIVLAHRCFAMGNNTVFGTLLEEFLHLDFMFQDSTRDFQNYLMDTISGLAREVHGPKIEQLRKDAVLIASPRRLEETRLHNRDVEEDAVAARTSSF